MYQRINRLNDKIIDSLITFTHLSQVLIFSTEALLATDKFNCFI